MMSDEQYQKFLNTVAEQVRAKVMSGDILSDHPWGSEIDRDFESRIYGAISGRFYRSVREKNGNSELSQRALKNGETMKLQQAVNQALLKVGRVSRSGENR